MQASLLQLLGQLFHGVYISSCKYQGFGCLRFECLDFSRSLRSPCLFEKCRVLLGRQSNVKLVLTPYIHLINFCSHSKIVSTNASNCNF